MTEESVFYLARGEAWGFPQLADGGHNSPEGVAKAAKLMRRIFRDEGPWVMVEVRPLTDLDPPINELDAAHCRDLVEGKPLRDMGLR